MVAFAERARIVTGKPIGRNIGARRDVSIGEAPDRGLIVVFCQCQPHASAALCRDQHQRLSQAFGANISFIDFNALLERFRIRPHQRRADLVQPAPGGLVAALAAPRRPPRSALGASGAPIQELRDLTRAGKQLSREIVQQIGLTFIIMLMGLAFWNDLSRHWSTFVEWLRGTGL